MSNVHLLFNIWILLHAFCLGVRTEKTQLCNSHETSMPLRVPFDTELSTRANDAAELFVSVFEVERFSNERVHLLAVISSSDGRPWMRGGERAEMVAQLGLVASFDTSSLRKDQMRILLIRGEAIIFRWSIPDTPMDASSLHLTSLLDSRWSMRINLCESSFERTIRHTVCVPLMRTPWTLHQTELWIQYHLRNEIYHFAFTGSTDQHRRMIEQPELAGTVSYTHVDIDALVGNRTHFPHSSAERWRFYANVLLNKCAMRFRQTSDWLLFFRVGDYFVNTQSKYRPTLGLYTAYLDQHAVAAVVMEAFTCQNTDIERANLRTLIRSSALAFTHFGAAELFGDSLLPASKKPHVHCSTWAFATHYGDDGLGVSGDETLTHAHAKQFARYYRLLAERSRMLPCASMESGAAFASLASPADSNVDSIYDRLVRYERVRAADLPFIDELRCAMYNRSFEQNMAALRGVAWAEHHK